MNNLTTEDIQFLKELSHELKTQDNRCTASPYYYSILEKKRRYGNDLINRDGRVIVFSDGGDITEFDLEDKNLDELKEFIIDFEYEDDIQRTINDITSIDELAEYIAYDLNINNEWDIYEYEYYDHYSNIFLTDKAIKQHIISNGHHYENPMTYLHHSFRNLELERLLAIVRDFGEDYEK